MSFHRAFKLDYEQTRHITVGVIFVAYALSIFVVPVTVAGVSLILTPIFAPDQPDLMLIVREYVLFSGLIAWCVGPVAVPAAWWVAKTQWVGWATAYLGGLAGGLIATPIFWMILRDRIPGDLSTFLWVNLPMATSYGIAVWFLMRLIKPEAFVKPE